MSVTSWFLVSSGGTRHRLPREMIFVGRDDCELMLQSRSVDKQHAVVNYEAGTDKHKVKDLGSLNGTFVNEVRIQEQMYITLKLDDKLRFGYDTNLFTVVRGELTVPEEALKHEKFTSGLLLSKKPSNGEPTKSPTKTLTKTAKLSSSGSTKLGENKAVEGVASSTAIPSFTDQQAKHGELPKIEEKITGDLSALHRGTPLYGQPSWWGDGDADDENSFKQEIKSSGKKHDSSSAENREARQADRPKEDGLPPPPGTVEPSYFEIPTKEGHMADNSIHEVPTKDTEGGGADAANTSGGTAPQGHASFTIEFDSTSPGKVTIKDHVSKFTAETHRPRGKKAVGAGGSGGGAGKELSTLQAAMIASESKVADWLAHNDPTMVRSESTEEDSKSIKSDVPVTFKRLKADSPEETKLREESGSNFEDFKGSKHEDGTQSDSENGVGLRFVNRRQALEDRLKAAHAQGGISTAGRGSQTRGSRTGFMIELYDEGNPRKRRSYSFSQTTPLLGAGVDGEGLCPQPPSNPKVFSISTSATTNTATDSGRGPAPISACVAAGAPTAARVLAKQRSEDPSVGRSSASTGLQTGSPTSPSEEALALGREAGTGGTEGEDDQSDKGTYTIELENRNPEEEEARRMIDKVFGVETEQNQDVKRPLEHSKQGVGKEWKTTELTVNTAKLAEGVTGDSSAWVSQWASLAANNTRTDPEGSGAESPAFVQKEREVYAYESGVSSLSAGSTTFSVAERKRRTLPQLPMDDSRAKTATKTPGLHSEIGEKQDTEPQEKESQLEHQGNSEYLASEITRKPNQGKTSTSSPSKHPHRAPSSRSEEDGGLRKRPEESKEAVDKSGKLLVRQGSFTIEKPSANVPTELIPHINRGGAGAGALGLERSDSAGSMDTATLLKDTEAVMAFLEAKLRDDNKHQPSRPRSVSPESDVDTASTASQVAAEAERRAANAAIQKRRSLSALHREKSNMSTSSKTNATSTSARDRLDRKTKTRTTDPSGRSDARRSVQHTTTPSSRTRQTSQDLTDDDQNSSFPISDILSSDQETYSGPTPGLGRSYGCGSLTSTDDLLHSKLEGRSGKTGPSHSSKSNRTLQASTATSLGKQAGLPQPRPTRASLLRRARLGDTSDTDLADADRVSVASEVSTTSSTSKPPSGRKAPSRLDMLAQPRRNRVGSISARSDSECTVTRSSVTSPRLSAETALRLGLRSSTPTESRLMPRMRANSVSKLTEAKPRTMPSGYSSPTESLQPEPESSAIKEKEEEELMASSINRWRRLPPEYGSTSEEEFSSIRNSPRHGRHHLRPHHPVLPRGSRLGPGVGSSATPGTATGPGEVVMKHRMREQEEYIRDWTAHSEEIARISQDLAKDLAVLAREIHDVAGEIDSVSSSGTAPSTTVSTAATTPGSAIDTHEEVGPPRGSRTVDIQESMRKLVDRVFDESLNFRKNPPVISTNKVPEINGRPVELRPRAPDSLDPRALRRRTWNREEAVLDSLLLHSVSQLSGKIRQSVDKTAGKIRILFKDKDRNWDEIESKLKMESDIPLLKTSNKEISSILLELKRVEKQLQVINVMVDPDGTLEALTSLGLTSPTTLTKSTTTSSGAQQIQQGPTPDALPGPGAPVRPIASSTTNPGEPPRDLGLGGGTGLQFSRICPSGEEIAIAQK